ncbi:MAG: IS607 family transposase [Candidatus Dormibacteria bacterium]
MNLTEWARRQGIHPHTAYRWFESGTLPVPAERVGPRTILVNVGAAGALPAAGVGLYARVSSHDQRSDLERQLARLTEWAAKAGQLVVRVESEVGSGMNGQRPQLRRLLSDPKVTTVVVEHRDRLARMNAELVEASLLAHGRRLVVLDEGEVEDDLVRDMVEVLTSFCAHLYGRRSARNRALKALNCAKHDVGPRALTPPPARETK